MSDLCCCLAFLKNIASVFITDMVSSIMDIIIVIILIVMFRFGHLYCCNVYNNVVILL